MSNQTTFSRSIVDEIRQQLPKATKAVRGAKGYSQAEKQRQLAIPLLKSILSEPEPFGLDSILEQSSLPDTVTNHIGTVLGAGQGGKGGMQLWKTSKGRFIPCSDNAVLVLEHVTDSMLTDFLDEMGWDESEFIARVQALPAMAGGE
ncbi:MAG: hypothetical protein RIK87_23500 [Fuerstiella sp.]